MSERGKGQRGSATIEMVLWLPLLFAMMFGVVELSRLWLAVAEVTAAAREGARTGAQTATSSGNVFNPAPAVAAIDAILAGAGLSGGATRSVVCPSGGGACVPGADVLATVTVTFNTAMPAFLPALSSISIQEIARMRYE